MLTDNERESIEPGVSILAQEIKKDKRTPRRVRNTQKVTELAFRLKSLRVLLTYMLIFATMAGVLVILDGMPHAPQRIWSWQEIWDKLSGPSAGVPLDFIKYLTCSLGWFMVAYVALTLVVEGLVDLLYLFSSRISGGQPGKVAQGLKKATGLLPVSPLRRALDGLLLGAAFFAVVTTVAGGHGATTGEGHHATSGKLPTTDNQPEAAGLVLETPGDVAANHAGNVEDASYKVAFQPQMGDYIPNSDHISSVFSQSNITSHVDDTSVSRGSVIFHSHESGKVVRHKVQADDTLWSLAERYYGDGQKYTQIYDVNLGQPVGGGSHFDSTGKIQVGWVLTIPDVNSIDAGNLWGLAGSVSGHVQEQPQSVYTVLPGDSMRSIAQKVLGDEMRWPEIWKLNQGQTMPDGRVPTNPDRIFPGWELKLPVTKLISQPQPQSPVEQNQPQSPVEQNQPQSPVEQNQPQSPVEQNQPQSPVEQNQPQSPVEQNQPQSPVEQNQPQSPVEQNQGNGATQQPVTTPAQPTTPQPQLPVGTTSGGNVDPAIKETTPASAPSQPPLNPTPVPAQAAPTPAATTTPQTVPAPQQPVTQNVVAQQPDYAQQHQENWLWPMLEGLGSLFTLSGLGFGLYRIGGALRRRRVKGELAEPRRSRWEAYREVNDWENENAPQTRAKPVIHTNQWGDESGFASTDRPIELLNLRARGFDADRPKLVLDALQTVFAEEGLPTLQPLTCIETGPRLTYFFTSNPQTLALYLKAATSEQETQTDNDNTQDYPSEDEKFLEEVENEENQTDEMDGVSSDRGKIIPFLFGLGHKGNSSKNERKEPKEQLAQGETTQDELVETIMSKLGGRAWITKQRDGLTVIVEGIELRYCYSPIIIDQPDTHNLGVEENIRQEEVEQSSADVGEQLKAEIETETRATDIYRAYNGDEDEAETNEIRVGLLSNNQQPQSNLEIRSFEEVRQEFTQISRENGVSQQVEQVGADIATQIKAFTSPYLFFGVGAVEERGFDFETASAKGYDQLEGSDSDDNPSTFGHFQLCLDESNHLLLVASKGDEAASSVLNNCIFQLAASSSPDEMALYLIDRPVALSDEEIQNIAQEVEGEGGFSKDTQTILTQELEYNREVFNSLSELPQTVAIVTGDVSGKPTNQASEWTQNTEAVIEMLLEEVVRRRARTASSAGSLEKGQEAENRADGEELQEENNLPRLVLAICDLAAVMATTAAGNNLLQLLSDGAQWGVYVMAAATYDVLTSQNQTSSSSQPLATIMGQFGTLGLMVAPDERSSEQLLGGSSAAFELGGEGDMLLRPTRGQQFRLRGFRTEITQVRKSLSVLQALYNSPRTGATEESIAEVLLSPLIDAEGEITTVDEVKPQRGDEVFSERLKSDSEIEVVRPSNTTQNPVPVLPASVSELGQSEEQDFSASIQAWRWRMLQKGLLQPVVTIHILHGLTIHFGLLPTHKKTPLGKGYYFPVSPDPLVAYAELKEVGLNYLTLIKVKQEDEKRVKLTESEILKANRVDQLLDETLTWKAVNSHQQEEEEGESNLATYLLTQGFKPDEVGEAFASLETALHAFAWLESDSLLPKIQNGDVALLSYLALHTGAQSSYSVGQSILKPTETDRQLLRNLEVRLNRTHKSLRNWMVECLRELFGDLPEITSELARLVAEVEKFRFILDDTRRETLKLDDRLVWVDLLEVDRLLALYKKGTIATPTADLIKWLEEAYYLVQSTADNYSDEVVESRLKLLGVWGDRYAADWENLNVLRQHIVQHWFDLNMALGDHYNSLVASLEQSSRKDRLSGLALEHYSQAALVQPTYPEPVKALIGLYHSKKDIAGLRAIYNDYCSNCKQDDAEPEEDVVELYHKAVGTRRKRPAESSSRQERKAV